MRILPTLPLLLLKSWSSGNRDVHCPLILLPLPLSSGEPRGWSAPELPLLPLPGQPVLLRGKYSPLSFTACLFPTPEPRVSPSADSLGRATALKPLGNGRVGIISSESIKEAPSAIGVKLAISQCLDLVLNLAT